MTDVDSNNESFEMKDLSAMIDKLRANPEIVASIASTFGLPSPGSTAEISETASNPALPNMLSSIAPIISSAVNQGDAKHTNDPRTNLLHALRPYLSPQRQEIVDYILKLSRMGDLLKKLK